MASSLNIQQCEYLYAASLPHAFANERVELDYITERISSLDHHISQLNTLRRVLHHRSCQLHNLLLPIHILPMEVLSCIFQQFVVLGQGSAPESDCYDERLARALVLSSVSSPFRHVALRTPELWMGIPLNLRTGEAIGQASSLLQHCIALAPCVGISVVDELTEVEARLAADILLTPNVTQKVKSFELFVSRRASHVWIQKLKSSSFPALDALKLEDTKKDLIHDFGIFKALTQLSIRGCRLDRSIIVPPSLQLLDIPHITRQALISVLSQCPNLVECVVNIHPKVIYDLDATKFIEPVPLNHLNRLTYYMVDAAETNLLVQSLRLPSLETLELCSLQGIKFISAIPLCLNVSNTITTLIIRVASFQTLGYDDLYQLCRLSFPKLEDLFLGLHCPRSFPNVIHALALLDSENSNPENRRLPALKSITLRTNGYTDRDSIRDALKEYRIGEAFSLHIQIDYQGVLRSYYTAELQEELASIVRGRRIEITWDDGEA